MREINLLFFLIVFVEREIDDPGTVRSDSSSIRLQVRSPARDRASPANPANFLRLAGDKKTCIPVGQAESGSRIASVRSGPIFFAIGPAPARSVAFADARRCNRVRAAPHPVPSEFMRSQNARLSRRSVAGISPNLDLGIGSNHVGKNLESGTGESGSVTASISIGLRKIWLVGAIFAHGVLDSAVLGNSGVTGFAIGEGFENPADHGFDRAPSTSSWFDEAHFHVELIELSRQPISPRDPRRENTERSGNTGRNRKP